MIAAIGWIALALGGAYVFGALTVFLASGGGLGGLESLPLAFALGAIVAVAWIALVIWWSPMAITFV